MAKITLSTLSSGYQSTTNLNDNFIAIQNELNNKVLYRNPPSGEPNQMAVNIDLNSNKVINAADGTNNSDYITLRQLNSAISNAGTGLISSLFETQKGSAATASKFTLSGMTYTPGANNLLVFKNGQKLTRTRDYVETSTTEVTMVEAPLSDDDFDFISNTSVTSVVADAQNVTYTPVGGVATNVAAQLDVFDTQLFYTDQTVQVLAGPGAVSLTAKSTHVVTTGADALTLADGSEGQEKFIVMKTDGGAGTLTPTNLGNGTTITFDDVGDSAHLIFTNGAWHFVGGTATLA